METFFSKQLQMLRKQSGITQEQLAAKLGVTAQAVSKWENGSYPDGDLLPKIADFFSAPNRTHGQPCSLPFQPSAYMLHAHRMVFSARQ